LDIKELDLNMTK
jgi:hypothetical protein